MLQEPLKLLRGCGGEGPRHEEDAHSRSERSSEPCGAITDEGGGDEHRPWRHIAKRHRGGEILWADPTGLTHGNAFNERKSCLATTKGQQADQHEAPE